MIQVRQYIEFEAVFWQCAYKVPNRRKRAI